MNELAWVDIDRHGDVAVARVYGEVDLSNAVAIIGALDDASQDGDLVVDLSALQFLDSAGIRQLIEIARRLTSTNRRLRVVVAPDAAIRPVVTVTELDRMVAVRDTVAQAIKELEDRTA